MYPRIMQLRRLVVIQNKVKIPIKPIKICLSLSLQASKMVSPLVRFVFTRLLLFTAMAAKPKRKKPQNHYWRVAPCQVQKVLIPLNSKRWGICKSITITYSYWLSWGLFIFGRTLQPWSWNCYKLFVLLTTRVNHQRT